MKSRTYSLADYILTIEADDPSVRAILSANGKIQIGGDGQYNGGVTVQLATDQVTTAADATGAWVHSMKYDRHGTIDVKLRQISDEVIRFIRICKLYYGSSTTNGSDIRSGLTLTLSKTTDSSFIITGEDCFIQKIPNQDFQADAGEQTWTFTCGRIGF